MTGRKKNIVMKHTTYLLCIGQALEGGELLKNILGSSFFFFFF